MLDLFADGQTVLVEDDEAQGLEPNAVLERADGTLPTLLGPGRPIALSPDGGWVATRSRDLDRLLLVPAGAGATVEVPLSNLLLGRGTWSHDGRRLWIAARKKDETRRQLFPVDVARRTLLDPIASNVLPLPIAISPDDRWIAAAGADGNLTVYPVAGGEPTHISSVEGRHRPTPAGWTSTGELWAVLPLATPPRLVRVQIPSGKITRTIEVDLREFGSDELSDARITPDESIVVVESVAWRVRLELVRGIPADR